MIAALRRVLHLVRCAPAIAGFLWKATRGYRLRPWRSPYLRWRVETFSGQHAETVTAAGMWHLLWAEKRQFLRFLAWIGDLKQKRR